MYGLERLAEMKEYLHKEKEQLAGKRLKEMQNRFADNGYSFKTDLETIMNELVRGRKEGSLVISYLRSSYITEAAEFYIAYYSDEPFVEEEPDGICYSMRELLKGVEDDREVLNRKLKEKFIRCKASEQEEIRRWYMDWIYREMEGIFEAALENMEGEKLMDVYYGNYMDRLEKIGRV